jgi:sugar (pentulose or hexulose) kinase
MTVEQQARQLTVHIHRISDWRRMAAAARLWEAGEDGQAPELSPDELLSGVITLMEAALRRAGVHPEELAGLGITASPHAVVAWEAVSGRPFGLWFTPPLWDTWSDEEKPAFLLDGEPGLRARVEGRGAEYLRIGGVDSWILWNLTQGETFAIDVSHDLSGLCRQETHGPLPASAWPDPVSKLGPAGRVAPIYLEGARPLVGSLAGVPASSLFSTGDERAGTAFIGYRQEGYAAVLCDRSWSLGENREQACGEAFSCGSRARPAVFCGHERGVMIGRFYAPQTVIDWVERLFYQRDALPEIAVALFRPGPFVARELPERPDRAALVGIARDTAPAELYASALRSLAFSAHEYILQTSCAGRVSESACLYTDDAGYGHAALFAYQTAISRRLLYCDKRSAAAFGSALLTAVGVNAISLQSAVDAARDPADRERYDIADCPDHVPSLYERWLRWNGRE